MDRDSFLYGYIYWTSQKAAIFENVFVLYPMQQVIYTNYSIILKKRTWVSFKEMSHLQFGSFGLDQGSERIQFCSCLFFILILSTNHTKTEIMKFYRLPGIDFMTMMMMPCTISTMNTF